MTALTQSLSSATNPLAATSGEGPKEMRLGAQPPIPSSGPWENPKRNYGGEGFLGAGLILCHLFPSLHYPESCIPHITGG